MEWETYFREYLRYWQTKWEYSQRVQLTRSDAKWVESGWSQRSAVMEDWSIFKKRRKPRNLAHSWIRGIQGTFSGNEKSIIRRIMKDLEKSFVVRNPRSLTLELWDSLDPLFHAFVISSVSTTWMSPEQIFAFILGDPIRIITAAMPPAEISYQHQHFFCFFLKTESSTTNSHNILM